MRGWNKLFAAALAGQGSAPSAPSKNIESLTTGKVLAATDPNVVPGVIPSAPGPGDVFKEGGDCTFSFTPDPSGTWKELNVQLMSGDNWNMVHLTTVATIDGTDASASPFTYPCPKVDPNSAIYFYQFSSPAAPQNLTWTTRFTIAAADGVTTPPTGDTQPDGQKIPWGVGKLEDPSQAKPIPSYLPGGSGAGASTTSAGAPGSTTSGSGSVSVTVGASTTSAGAGAGSTTSAEGSQVTTTTLSGLSKPNAAQAGSSTRAATAPSQSADGGDENGAVTARANLAVGAVAVALTAAVFGFLS